MFQEEAGEPCLRPILRVTSVGSLLVPPGQSSRPPPHACFLSHLIIRVLTSLPWVCKNLERKSHGLLASVFLLLNEVPSWHSSVSRWMNCHNLLCGCWGQKMEKETYRNKSFGREGKVSSNCNNMTCSSWFKQLVHLAIAFLIIKDIWCSSICHTSGFQWGVPTLSSGLTQADHLWEL